MNTVQPIRDLKKLEQIKDTLKNWRAKYYILWLIGLNTGLRVSDILLLKTKDVRDKLHLSITEQKTGKRKRILINEHVQRALYDYLRRECLEDNEYLIPSQKGKNRPITRIQAYRVLHTAAELHGVSEIGTHTMRKTFGYWHYKTYHDVAMLQDIFNHSSPSITLRYIGMTDDAKDETIKNFYL